MHIINDLIIRVLKGEKVDRPPVWMMRQAGRYLSQYRAVRSKAGSFKKLLETPELAAEVTLQPVDLLNVDAAIIFSDILVVAEAIGFEYEMQESKGPVFLNPFQNLNQFKEIDLDANSKFTLDAISLTQKQLSNKIPLFGFAGAPWTIFAYIVEGSGSKTFSKAKALLYKNPEVAHKALQKITDATILYLKAQIESGANLIQIFDSWAGILSPQAFNEFSLPYLKQIGEALIDIPKIVFAKGAILSIDKLSELNYEGIGLDWNVTPEFARNFTTNKVFQGNLDPCVLYSDLKVIEKSTIEMLQKFGTKHIANLGHGIYPDVPFESAQTFIKTVLNYRY